MNNRFSTFKNSFESRLEALDVTIKVNSLFHPIKDIKIVDKEQSDLVFSKADVTVNDVKTETPGDYLVKVENIQVKSEPDKTFYAEYSVTVEAETQPTKPLENIMPVIEEEDLYETTKPYTFTLKPSTRDKLRELTKMQKKKSDSAFLSEVIDTLYDSKI
ncbi:hypothetical protein FZ048_14625 [Listeria monocytogenes]|uniref:hypothetical protein n=1 Tax=Listeria monocytogenes TaxID=1639 RepID=UPI000F0D78CB|nr:hypothetical protein [Listeria monocytogenes]EAD1931267.1 hypothetical protein [Listeria monocytogenes]EAD2804441.1 hypothetical protein [Listeria monocytogenes]EAE7705653.1 hypothetical protein [Listeria monocytogenes]EIL9560010.1 hypothetical protein [Listeria monocytogenes]EIL9717192.1 hypothetical protein [Listeria monocytogenes]